MKYESVRAEDGVGGRCVNAGGVMSVESESAVHNG